MLGSPGHDDGNEFFPHNLARRPKKGRSTHTQRGPIHINTLSDSAHGKKEKIHINVFLRLSF